jgi:hypothetical protein
VEGKLVSIDCVPVTDSQAIQAHVSPADPGAYSAIVRNRPARKTTPSSTVTSPSTMDVTEGSEGATSASSQTQSDNATLNVLVESSTGS